MTYKIKEIPGFPGYWADSDGDIWSAKRKGSIQEGWIITDMPIRKLTKRICNHGYYRVKTSVDGMGESKNVHSLVLIAFTGARPKGFVCCHFDGDKLNNKNENLRWDTYSANVFDSIRHGTKAMNNLPPVEKGEAHMNSKLKTDEVVFIKKNKGIITQTRLAIMFKISRWTIRQIHDGINWRHITV